MLWEPFVFGIFGAIIGSFLNVVILRRGTKSLEGRSGCFSCGAQLRAHDMIPILSWIMLRGRCRACGSAISVQYPLVEAATAISFAAIGAMQGISIEHQLLFCAIAAFLILIAAYDARHTIIPDEWAYGFALLSLISIFTLPRFIPLSEALLAGPLAAMPLAALWLVSRGRWMGLGDAKLALGIGWLLGPVYGLLAVFLSFVIGAIVGVLVLLPLPVYARLVWKAGIARVSGSASYTMKSEVPFGPFLVLSSIIVWFSIWYRLPIPLPF